MTRIATTPPVALDAGSHAVCVDLFCGGGGLTAGLLEAAADIGTTIDLFAINHWGVAIDTHTKNHPQVRHLCESLEGVDPREVVPSGIVDLLAAAPECFPAGTLILTGRGLVPIEEVQVGDKVWTHGSRWRRVLETGSRMADTVKLSGYGHFGLETTADHPFWVRNRRARHRPDSDGYRWRHTEPEWRAAAQCAGAFWATPADVSGPEVPPVNSRVDMDTEEFWWLVGRWLADGCVTFRRRTAEISIACAFDEESEILSMLDRAGIVRLGWKGRRLRTASLFTCRSIELGRWLTEHFGKLAHGKTIPAWALGLHCPHRRALLDGYISGDGHDSGRRRTANTVSKRLAIGLRLLTESFGYASSLTIADAPNGRIEGRTVASRAQYRLGWSYRELRRLGYIDRGFSWLPIRKIIPGRSQVKVFNLSVEEDQSYVADGIVVHNCIHHSRARGGKPMSPQSRASIYHVLRWCDSLHVKNVLIENVREIMDWGPLHDCSCDLGPGHADKHPKPCKFGRPIMEKKGLFFRRFLGDLRARGYRVEYRLLNAAHYGDATSRIRFFLQATREDRPIVWPTQTHVAPNELSLFHQARPWRTAREIINWDLRGKSIYNRKRPLAVNTIRRIFAGLHRFCGMPTVEIGDDGRIPLFLFRRRDVEALAAGCYLTEYHGGRDGARRTRTVDEPVPTCDTSNRFGLVDAVILPVTHSGDEGRSYAVDVPIPTITGAHRGEFAIGAPYLVPNFGERDGQTPRTHDVGVPLPAVTGHGAGAVVQPYILPHQHGSSGPNVRDTNEPLPTITGTSSDMFLADPVLVPQFTAPDTRSVDRREGTLTATSRGVGLGEPYLEPCILGAGGTTGQQAAQDIDAPIGTILSNDRRAIAEPVLVALEHSTDATGHDRRICPVDEPMPKVTARAAWAHVAPYLVKFYGGYSADTVERPLGAITANFEHYGLVEPYLVVFRNNMDGARPDKPLGTVCTSAGHFGLAEPQIVNYNGTGLAHSVDDPLDTVTTHDRFGLVEPVTADDGDLVALDILFRMLQPEELAAAHSFRTDYVFCGTRDEQVKQIGNSVPVQLARALCRCALGRETHAPSLSLTVEVA